MNKKSRMLALFSVMLLSGWLAACQKEEQGPAEEVGKKMDDAAHKVGEKMEDAGEKMKDAVD